MQHHGEGLLRELGDDNAAIVDAIKVDYRTADLSPADRAMLDYVAKLTVAPATCSEDDIALMRTQQFSDEAILEINQITGFFAWCNRTVDGLGVELESFWDDPTQTNI